MRIVSAQYVAWDACIPLLQRVRPELVGCLHPTIAFAGSFKGWHYGGLSDISRPFWNDQLAQNLLGKTILVGITYVNPEGERRVELYGVVVSVDENAGLSMQ